jgi:hypothetical protein
MPTLFNDRFWFLLIIDLGYLRVEYKMIFVIIELRTKPFLFSREGLSLIILTQIYRFRYLYTIVNNFFKRVGRIMANTCHPLPSSLPTVIRLSPKTKMRVALTTPTYARVVYYLFFVFFFFQYIYIYIYIF